MIKKREDVNKVHVIMALRDYLDGIEDRTADLLSKICDLKGLSEKIEWDGYSYRVAHGMTLGPSVHSVMAWIDGEIT